MRLATIRDGSRLVAAVVDEGSVLPLAGLPGLESMRGIAAAGDEGLRLVTAYAARSKRGPGSAWRPLDPGLLAPAVPDPGAIYTVGVNYRSSAGDDNRPERPLIYGKLPGSVAAPGGTLRWDGSIAPNVDPEVELGVVIGTSTTGPVDPADAMRHVFGWTCINDISARDAWLDGDQWLLGKSMPGFCPVGPWIVPRDELDVRDLRLIATINGQRIQDGRTSAMRFGVAEVVAFLSRHVELRPGDLIASGTPRRLDAPPGPARHLQPGDVVSIEIEGIGELVTHVA